MLVAGFEPKPFRHIFSNFFRTFSSFLAKSRQKNVQKKNCESNALHFTCFWPFFAFSDSLAIFTQLWIPQSEKPPRQSSVFPTKQMRRISVASGRFLDLTRYSRSIFGNERRIGITESFICDKRAKRVSPEKYSWSRNRTFPPQGGCGNVDSSLCLIFNRQPT